MTNEGRPAVTEEWKLSQEQATPLAALRWLTEKTSQWHSSALEHAAVAGSAAHAGDTWEC